MITAEADRLLADACARAGLDLGPAELLRLSENAVYRLADEVVARVSRSGRIDVAANEVRVARWLEKIGFTAVRVLPDVEQPINVDGVAVTFWRELPAHREGGDAQLAAALRALHRLPPPTEFTLPPFAPLGQVRERISEAVTISPADRDWLSSFSDELETRLGELPSGLPSGVVHGDAWFGNLAVDDDDNAWLLDFERFSAGPPEWDLVSTAVRMTTFGTLDAAGHDDFCAIYGHDVTQWAGFETLRDIREMRTCSYMLKLAETNSEARAEAARRVACLRGRAGSRPWNWKRIV